MNSFFCLRKIYRHAFSIVVLLFIFNGSKAGTETSTNGLSTPTLSSSSMISVEDNKYNFMTANLTTWQNSFRNRRIKNRVIFSIDESSTKMQHDKYTATVTFQLTSRTWSGVNFTTTTVPKTLVINYNKNLKHTNKIVYEFTEALSVDIHVTNLVATDDGTPVPISQTNLSLETEIEVERYYPFNAQFLPTGVSHDEGLIATQGELEFHWDVIPGAEEYDLEWTYVNNYDGNGDVILPQNLKIDERIFQFNSTRISTTNTFYKIPYIYGKGYILYRVRGAGKTAMDDYTDLMEGRWSSDGLTFTTVNAYPKKYLYQGSMLLQSNDELNWQSSITFAEEGKSKTVLNYFDGSLRNRQSVTKSKTIDQIIVGESIYDYQGRPAIQVLPVPAESSVLRFNPNFNQNKNGVAYSKHDFDEDETACDVETDTMWSLNSGASNYYSFANADKKDQQAYVPNAQGYPFSQVEYTPDNTGRIRAQGGVGKAFQLGTKHETNYFYTTPEQEELDRLFGSEVGNALHYKKNMVRDANGQLSVSFLDPQGRVIATCLAGKKPTALDELESARKNYVTTDLFSKVKSTDYTGPKNELDLSKRSLTVNKQIIPELEGKHIFSYEMRGQKYQPLCSLLSYPVCYDCIFDLKISLTDECGKEYLNGVGASDVPNSPPVGPVKINETFDPHSSCSTPAPSYSKGISPVDSWKTTISGVETELDPSKTYNLTKTLTLNQKALDTYTADYLNSGCVKTYDYFLDEEIKKINLESCDEVGCAECAARLEPYSDYNIIETPNCSPCLTRDEWQKLKDQCYENCNIKSETCEAAYENMLADVSLLGQYGQIMPGGGVVDGAVIDIDPAVMNPEAYPLSVFNESNLLPRKLKYRLAYEAPGQPGELKNSNWAPTWRFPYNPKAPVGKQFTYLDQYGAIAVVPVTKTASGSYVPEIISESYLEGTPGKQYIRPQFLKNLFDFVRIWNPSWAEALVHYHPEYDYYTYCLDIAASHDFDGIWQDIELVADAKTTWPGHATGSTTLSAFMDPVGIDPYFNTSNPHFSATEKAAMINAMKSYSNGKSMQEVAFNTVKCPNSAMGCSSCPTYNDQVDFDSEVWNVFKSMYFGLKQKFQQQSATQYAIQEGCYNGCIGAEEFNPFLNKFYQSFQQGNSSIWTSAPFNFVFFRSQFFNFEQPCNVARHFLYKEKQMRFPGISDLLDINSINMDLCYSTTESDAFDPQAKFEIVDCPAKTQAIVKESENLMALSLYQQCGQCPNAHNLETFLNSLVTKTAGSELLGTNLHVSCSPPANYPEFTQNLATALGFSSLTDVVYTASLDNPTKTLTSTFSSGAQSCNVKFKFTTIPTGTAPYPPNVEPNPAILFINDASSSDPNLRGIKDLYTFSDIVKICCLKYISNPSLFLLSANRNFQLTATVKVKEGDPLYEESYNVKTNQVEEVVHHRELIIEGVTTCFNVGGCTFDPVCKTSKEAVQFQTVLNALLYTAPDGGPGLPAIESAFSNTTAVQLNVLPYNGSYQQLRPALNLSAGLGINEQPNWTWRISNFMPHGIIAKIETSTGTPKTCTFSLSLPAVNPNNYGFSDIIKFSNIRPDEVAPLGGNFKITALVKTGNLPPEYIDLTGTMSCLNLGDCSNTLPRSMVLGNTKTTYEGIGLKSCNPSQDALNLQQMFNDIYTGSEFDRKHFLCEGNSVLNFIGNCGELGGGKLKFPEGSEYSSCDASTSNAYLYYEDIIEFSGIMPDPDFAIANAINHNFIIYATFSNGVKVQLKGILECIDVGTCNVIAETCNSWDTYNKVVNGDFELGDQQYFETDLESQNYITAINQYGITTNAYNQYNGWVGTDHTSGSGNFMAAVSDDEIKTIWKQDGVHVEKNKSYRFTAWVSYLLNGSGAFAPESVMAQRLKLAVNGNVTGVTSSGVFVGPTVLNLWQQVEFIWNSGNNTIADLRIMNEPTAGDGGIYHFGLDDISFQACKPTDISVMCDITTIPLPDVEVDPNPCKTQLLQIATLNANVKYAEYIDGLKKQFQENYIKKCLDVYEDFHMKYWDTQHHFTLYYYDQAGNLVRTIPPDGVNMITAQTDLDKIRLDRFEKTHTFFTQHTMATTYKYNSLNQLIAQTSPDVKDLEIWNPEPINQGIPAGDEVLNTTFSDANHGNAFTKDALGVGHIYVTVDGGKTWTEINNIGIADLNDVKFVSATTAYAIGNGGIVMKTDNLTTWRVATPPTKDDLLRIFFSSVSDGKAFTRTGVQWITSDGGNIWSIAGNLSAIAPGQIFTDITFSGLNAVAVTQSGKIYTSYNNNGVNWEASPDIRTVDLNKVVAFGGKRFAIGKDGRFLRSDDAGATWNLIGNQISTELKNMYFDYISRGFVIDNNGTVRETNGAGTWNEIKVGGVVAPHTFKNIFFNENDHEGYAFNADGSYSKFSNEKWSAITSGISGVSGINKFFCITPFDVTGIGFMAGQGGTIYKKSTTGTWPAWVVISGENIVDMYFANVSNTIKGVALTESGKIFYLEQIPGNAVTTTPISGVHKAINFITDGNGFAIAENGTLVTTSNYGASWTTASAHPFPGTNKLKSISFLNDGVHGVAGGEKGELWISDNTGWSDASYKTKLPYLTGVSLANDNIAYAVGANGTVVKTSNLSAGTTIWEQLPTGITKNLNAVAFSTVTTGVVVGDAGFVGNTGSGGALWGTTTAGTANLSRVSFSTTANEVIAVGSNCTVIKSTNNGINWGTPLTLTGSSVDGLRAVAANGSNLLAVGQNGTILKSSGTTLTRVSTFEPPVLNDAQLISKTGIAVGNNGNVLVTNSGGTQWSIKPSGTKEHLNALHFFPDALKAVTVGNNGKALLSADAGNSWSSHPGFPEDPATQSIHLNDVHYSGDFGIIVGNTGHAFTLLDNGVNTWSPLTTPVTKTGENINAVYIVDKTLAYAVGDDGTVLSIEIHTDGTTAWELLPKTNPSENLTDVYFKDYTTGYAIGEKGTLFKTTNRGQDWNKEDVIGTTSNFKDLTIIDNNNIIVSGSSGNVTHVQDMKNEFASLFWYDKLGRIVVSQNGKQFNKVSDHLTYSFTKYDALGRIEQVGEIHASNQVNPDGIYGAIERLYDKQQLDPAKFNIWLSRGTKKEVTTTSYDDIAFTGDISFQQTNLRKRVSASFYDEDENDLHGYDHATYYSYDIHGNVKSLVQENRTMGQLYEGQTYKRIDYEYDLISGNVKQVSYQDGEADAFYHKYEYDADNRITNMYTSTNKVIWDQDAKYFYYKHGPLARTELGNDKVQGIDYAYTLQGWVKAVNSNNLAAANDIGKDADVSQSTNINKNIAKDVYGYNLNYYLDKTTSANDFNGDYMPIDNTKGNLVASITNAAYIQTDVSNLYNGNISSMGTTIINNTGTSLDPILTAQPQLTAYRYDQLNRIKEMHAYRDQNNLVANNWALAADDESYYSKMEYDPNGNLTLLQSNGNAADGKKRMDILHYHYETTPTTKTNKLAQVTDEVDELPQHYDTDIKTQGDIHNYKYDDIGNLVHDEIEDIEEINWTATGKIKSIYRDVASLKEDLEFTYDAQGNRTSKIVKPKIGHVISSPDEWITTYYVRDASGNVMGTYKNKKEGQTNDLYLQEQNLFGSSRVGVEERDLNLSTPSTTTPGEYASEVGDKQFELSNHLDNVLTTISDIRIPNEGTGGMVGSYSAQLKMAQDYYPFGAPMPKRGIEGDYLYGYQGSEKDNEMKGNNNSYTTHHRILDPRLGRWLSIDPKANITPGQSPYVSMDNNPITFNDVLGDIVGYEKFRDRVNVALARIYSRSFRQSYRNLRDDKERTYTFQKRYDYPRLIDGPVLSKVDENNFKALYSAIGSPTIPEPAPSPTPTPGPLDDKVRSPKTLSEPDSEFEADYTINDYTGATLNVNAASYSDKIEIISKGQSITLRSNKDKKYTDADGYTKYTAAADLEKLYQDGKIDDKITIKITGNPKYKTYWSYHIKAKSGTQDRYSSPVKHEKVKN